MQRPQVEANINDEMKQLQGDENNINVIELIDEEEVDGEDGGGDNYVSEKVNSGTKNKKGKKGFRFVSSTKIKTRYKHKELPHKASDSPRLVGFRMPH